MQNVSLLYSIKIYVYCPFDGFLSFISPLAPNSVGVVSPRAGWAPASLADKMSFLNSVHMTYPTRCVTLDC